MNKVLCFSVVIAIAIGSAISATNYCEIPCSRSPHIGCNNSGIFSSTCSADAKFIPLTDAQKQKIVLLHNTNRNKVALGTVNNLKPAARMATAVYDPELGDLAGLNVRQCAMKHDACRNTVKCKLAGQNLFRSWTTGTLDIDKLIEVGIQSWFDEYTVTTNADIDSYPANTNGRVIGHFTSMVRESSISLGCAISVYTSVENGKTVRNFLFACNYCTTNLLNTPVYSSAATPASSCSAKNPQFPGLCIIGEPYST